eukprot:3787611-Pleurochrysis_carterae.AAC.1
MCVRGSGLDRRRAPRAFLHQQDPEASEDEGVELDDRLHEEHEHPPAQLPHNLKPYVCAAIRASDT